MAKEFDETNRGVLFKNHKREKDSHPQYTGKLNVEGAEYWVSAWLKEAKNGEKFFSISIKEKESKPAERPRGPAAVADMSDDIPFLFDISTVRDTMGLSRAILRIKNGQKTLSILCANKTEC